MLKNKEIRELLRQNRGDFVKFQKFLKVESRQALEYRLKDNKIKNNLDGVYKEFLINQKGI